MPVAGVPAAFADAAEPALPMAELRDLPRGNSGERLLLQWIPGSGQRGRQKAPEARASTMRKSGTIVAQRQALILPGLTVARPSFVGRAVQLGYQRYWLFEPEYFLHLCT